MRLFAYVPPSHWAPTLVLTPRKREELLEHNSHQSWTVEHLQQTRSRQEIMRQIVAQSDTMSSLVPRPHPKNWERSLVSLASSPGPTQGEGDSKRGEGGGESGERRERRWYLIDTRHHMTHFVGGQR